MQIPYRKPGKFSLIKNDPLMTQGKFDELTRELDHLKHVKRPHAAAEVARLAELGDFSENAEYQLAKGRLRGINNAILRIEHQLKEAAIIPTGARTDTVAVGHIVTIESEGKQKTFQILGSSETNPDRGIISHHSPLGAALIGRKIADMVTIQLAGKTVKYKIVKIK